MVNDAVIVVKEEVIRGNETLQTKIGETIRGNETLTTQLGTVQQGVCETIPYYQAEIARLKASLQHQTLLADRAEKRLADTTRIKNKLKETTAELDEARLKNSELGKLVRLYETMDTVRMLLDSARSLPNEEQQSPGKRARAE